MTTTPRATVVVVPRDSFAETRHCLDRLLDCTPEPRRIVIVDGGSPPDVAELLRSTARMHDLALVRSDAFLTPNEARNVGLGYVATDWVAFVDNDVYVEPEWLERLVACGDETGAAAVTPLVCIGPPERRRIHIAGGDCGLTLPDGTRGLWESHPQQNLPLATASSDPVRRECGMFEFHTVLLRHALLREVSPLDEGLRSLLEHVDLSLALRARGGTLWYEPAVSVTYIPSRSLRGADFDFFVTRWSDDWNRRSAARFAERWGLPTADPRLAVNVEFGAWLRSHAYLPYRSPLRRFAQRRGRVPRPLVDRLAQRRALRRYTRTIGRPPRLVHEALWIGAPCDA